MKMVVLLRYYIPIYSHSWSFAPKNIFQVFAPKSIASRRSHTNEYLLGLRNLTEVARSGSSATRLLEVAQLATIVLFNYTVWVTSNSNQNRYYIYIYIHKYT